MFQLKVVRPALFAGLLVLLASACQEVGPDYGRLSGTVTDIVSHARLVEVTVGVIGGPSALTDDTGGYHLKYVAPGTVTLVARADGYDSLRTEVDVPGGAEVQRSLALPRLPSSVPPPAPATLSAVQTSAGTVEVRWDASPGATAYNVYRSRAPGVSRSDYEARFDHLGEADDDGKLRLTDDLLLAGTAYYVVTALGRWGESTESPAMRVALNPDIVITWVRPTAPGVVRDFAVSVSVTSRLRLDTVKATVAGRTARLTFGNACPTPQDCGSAWRGVIPDSGIAAGIKTVVVEARDSAGGVAGGSMSFVFNRRPRVQVIAPRPFEVATSDIAISAACEDEDVPNCHLSIGVLLGDFVGAPETVLARGLASLSTTLSLSGISQTSVVLAFHAWDDLDGGQTGRDSTYLLLYVLKSEHLVERARVAGTILDADDDRILYAADSGAPRALKVRNRASGQDELVSYRPDRYLGDGQLAPLGAIFEEYGPTVTYLNEWRNGSLILLDQSRPPNVIIPVVVRGNYVAWPSSSGFMRRDLLSGTSTTLTGVFDFYEPFSLAANGDVVWTYQGEVIRYRAGATTALTPDAPFIQNYYPVTDGVNVVFTRQAAPGQPYQTILITPGGEVPLTNPDLINPAQYLAVNGWVAFTAGNQVWTRSPAGEVRQVSFFNSPSYLNVLGPAGEVVLIYTTNLGAELYLATPPYSATSPLACPRACTLFWIGTTLYATIGGSLFEVR